MSLKRGEVSRVVTVKEEKEKETVVGGEMDDIEDVHVAERRQLRPRGRRTNVVSGGKMRLRGHRFGGGKRVRGEDNEKAAKKQERKDLVLAKKLSREEFRKGVKRASQSGKEELKSRSGSRSRRSKSNGSSKSRSLERCHSENRSKTEKKAARKEARQVSKALKASTRRRSESREPESQGFLKKRRGTKSPATPKTKLTPEEKLARKEARKASKALRVPKKDLPKILLGSAQGLVVLPIRTIQWRKIVEVPKTFRSMKAAAGRR